MMAKVMGLKRSWEKRMATWMIQESAMKRKLRDLTLENKNLRSKVASGVNDEAELKRRLEAGFTKKIGQVERADAAKRKKVIKQLTDSWSSQQNKKVMALKAIIRRMAHQKKAMIGVISGYKAKIAAAIESEKAKRRKLIKLYKG